MCYEAGRESAVLRAADRPIHICPHSRPADRDWTGCQFTTCASCDARGPNDGTALRVANVRRLVFLRSLRCPSILGKTATNRPMHVSSRDSPNLWSSGRIVAHPDITPILG